MPQTQPYWPAPALTLDYDVSAQVRSLSFRASSRLIWRATGKRYEAELDMRIRLVGARTQRSSGRWTASGLQPERFFDQARRERRYEMDWEQSQFSYFRAGERLYQGALQAGAQDRLSLFFELALHAERWRDGANAAKALVPVLGPRGVQPWAFAFLGAEQIQTPAGTFLARRLQRQTSSADDTRMDLWLHESLGYLPVRILLQDDDGEVVDQRLRQWART